MSKRIIVTGATGLIGSHISNKLIERGDEVVVLSRSPERAEKKLPGAFKYVEWHYSEIGKWKDEINNANAIIHLAGENLMSKRWTDKHKMKVMESRVLGTGNLVKAIGESDKKPEVFICASGIDIYDDSIDKEYDEEGKHGSGFLARVVENWEEEASKVEKFGVRRVSVRTGIVLDKSEGALAKMVTPFKFFVGGPLGSGEQWMPWIHIDDISDLYNYSIDNVEINGAINATAPNPVRMKEFAETLGKVMSRPALFKVPAVFLKIVVGEAAEVVLKGSKIIPRKTLEYGFAFKFTQLDEALKDIL